ncbi:MAG TPA: PIN domain-containing protein [Ilumatobacteraceae bacterium]|nr:PIN domain-containing protein [Ilumatobacteraceae bacterium]
MLIADTSAWVEWLRQRESPADLALDQAFADDLLVLLEPVKAELLMGARDRAEVGTLRRLLETVDFELVYPRDDFESATELFHTARRRGVTVRGVTDGVIAAMAIRLQLPILHHDQDFARLAPVIDLQEARGSLALV